MDLALNKQQRLICHKTQTNQKQIKQFEVWLYNINNWYFTHSQAVWSIFI